MSLTLHRKVHEGLTTCSVCGAVCSKVAHLRRHLETVHRMPPQRVRQLAPNVRLRNADLQQQVYGTPQAYNVRVRDESDRLEVYDSVW